MRLDDLCDTYTGAGPFEGSGLNYVINPVTIGNVRGFTDWLAGGCAVLEEVFPSRNYVEFCLLHIGRFVDGLFAIHCALGKSPNLSIAELICATHARVPDFWERATSLLGNLAQQRRIDAELERRGISAPRTADEAGALFHETFSNQRDALADPNLVEFLRDLANRRFGHLDPDAYRERALPVRSR
jgi:hypothetical protein